MSDYVYQPYPAMRFHRVHGTKVVENAAEDEALGEGWVKTIYELDEKPAEKPADPPDDEPDPKPRAKKK